MTLAEALLAAAASLGAHKLRSLLTMLGMIFGVGAAIAMLAIGEGAERQALETIERLGLRHVLVRARDLSPEDLGEVRIRSLGLSERDAAAVAAAVPGVERVAPRVEKASKTNWNRMSACRAPTARRTPISWVRSSTVASMMFMMPKRSRRTPAPRTQTWACSASSSGSRKRGPGRRRRPHRGAALGVIEVGRLPHGRTFPHGAAGLVPAGVGGL